MLRGLHHLFPGDHIVRCRKNRHMTQLGLHLSGHGINFHDPVYLIPKKFHPEGLTV